MISTYHSSISKQKRSNLEILHRILKCIASKNYALKTHVLYASGLNTRTLDKYLRGLMSSELIIPISDGRHMYFTLTSKGRDFLFKLEQLLQAVDAKNRRLTDSIKIRVNVLSKKGNAGAELSEVVILEPSEDVENGVIEVFISYVHSKATGRKVTCFVPSKIYDKLTELLSGANTFFKENVIPYNEYDDLDRVSEFLAKRILELNST